MGRYWAIGTATVAVLILIKDGTLPTLAKDVATGIGDLSKGLKPVTTIA